MVWCDVGVVVFDNVTVVFLVVVWWNVGVMFDNLIVGLGFLVVLWCDVGVVNEILTVVFGIVEEDIFRVVEGKLSPFFSQIYLLMSLQG